MPTPEQRAAVVDALQGCTNAAAVARSIGQVSAKVVQKIAREEDIALKDGHSAKGRRNRVSDEQKQHAVALLRQERNAALVSRLYPDLSHTTLVNIAHQDGIELTASLAKGGGPHLSRQRRITIVEAIKVNPNAARVARDVGGVSSRAVQRIAKKRRIPLTVGLATRFTSKITRQTRLRILSALAELPNAAAVARQFKGIRETVVRRIAKTHGLELSAGKAVRKQSKISAETQAEIIEALKLNSNAATVARQFDGASHGIVIRLAKQAGIDLVAGRRSGRGDRKPPHPETASPSWADLTATTLGVALSTAASLPRTPDNEVSRLSAESRPPEVPPPPADLAKRVTPSAGRSGKDAGVGASNLVKALEAARASSDKARVSSLISLTPSDLLREALTQIQVSKLRVERTPAVNTKPG